MSQFSTKDLLDDAVRRTRANTPPEVVNKRAVPRMSIDEINATDFDTLRERYLNTRRDDRGPVTKFLDAIDAPRNQILATLAPGIARREKEQGNTGAFGTGRVSVRDVLGEMGMAPGIVRGVLGFVGDVAFDPLTYAGGVGIGAKIATNTGRVVSTGRALPRALKAADKAARGGAALTPEMQAVRKVVGEGSLQKGVLGSSDRAATTLTQKAGRAVSEIIGGGRPKRGGLIAESEGAYTLKGMDPAIRAGIEERSVVADQLLKKYSLGAGPAAIKIGKDAGGKLKIQVGAKRGDQAVDATQSLFHVPFTDVSLLSVPAFGSTSKQAAVTLARAAMPRFGIEAAQGVAEIGNAAREAQNSAKRVAGLNSEWLKYRQDNAEAVERVEKFGRHTESFKEYPLLNDPDAPIRARLDEFDNLRSAEMEKIAAMRKAVTDNLDKIQANPGKYSAPQILAMRDEADKFAATASAMMVPIEKNREFLKARSVLLARESERMNEKMDFLRRAAAMDEASSSGFAGTIRAGRHPSGVYKDEAGRVIPIDDAATQTAVLADVEARGVRLAELRKEQREIKSMLRKGVPDPQDPTNIIELLPDDPQYIALVDKLNGVRSGIRALSDKVVSAGGDGSAYGRPILDIDQHGQTILNADDAVLAGVQEPALKALDRYEDAMEELWRAERNMGNATIGQQGKGLTKEAIRAEVQAAREDLLRITEPLRGGPSMRTIEDAEEAIRAADRANVSSAREQLAELYNVTDEEARAFDQVTTAMQQAVAASLSASLATKMSAISYMTPEMMRAIELQKDFLNSGSAIVGAASMAPMRTIAGRIFAGDNKTAALVRRSIDEHLGKAAEAGRKAFGSPSGEMSDQLRHAMYMMGTGGNVAANNKLAEIERDIRTIAKSFGMGGREDELLTLATAKAIERSGGHAAFHVQDVKGNLTGYAQALKDAHNKGLTTDPKIVAAIEEFVAKHDMLTTFREIETAEGLLGPGAARTNYFTNILTKQGSQYIGKASRASLAGGQSPLTRARMIGQQAFQKQRTTDSAQFVNSAGVPTEVWHGDRWVQSMSDAEISAIPDTALGNRLTEMKANLDEYDRLPSQPPMKANDPFRLNTLKDRFRPLWGADEVPGGFMDSNFATIMAGRLFQHEKALAQEVFKREVIAAGTLPIGAQDLREFAKVPHGTVKRLQSGLTGKIVQLGNDSVGIKIGDDVFRGLSKDIRNMPDNPMLQAMGNEGLGAIYHQSLAERIENAAKTFGEQGRGFWSALDKVTAEWKRLTLLHPSWWISNVIGESLNYVAQDPYFAQALTKYMKPVYQMFRLRNDPEKLAKIVVEFGGEKMNGLEYMRRIQENPLRNSAGVFSEEAARSVQGGKIVPSRFGTARQSVKPQAFRTDFEMAAKAAVDSGSSDIAAKAKAGLSVAGDRANRYIFEPWRNVNSLTSDMLRNIAYLSLRDRGWSESEAIRRVVRAGFDYNDLTPFEKNVGRRIFPFWTWMKNNSVYQAKLLMEKPMYVGSLPILQGAIEEAVNGEAVIPMNQRPSWMRENLAIQFGQEDKGRTGILVGNLLPQEQALMLGRAVPGIGGLQESLKYLVSSITPLARTPIEIGAGREFFSGRDIGAGDSGDITPTTHVLNQIRPIREAKKLVSVAKEQTPAAVLARSVIGGRAQPMSDERIRVSKAREFQEEEGKLRKAIRTAEFKGDKARSVVKRAELLRLYETMENQGHSESVPKWARKRLESLSSP